MKITINPNWISVVIALLALIGGVIAYFKGDKRTRSDQKIKIIETQNLYLDFLAFMLNTFRISSDCTAVLSGSTSDYDNNIRELTQKIAEFNYCTKLKFYRYLILAKKFKMQWEKIYPVKKENKVIRKFNKLQNKIIQKLKYLGNKTGRMSEVIILPRKNGH